MISLDEVKHLADLAHMELSEAELKKLQGQMELILDYISQLKEVEIEGVEPVAGGHQLLSVWREEDSPEDQFAFEKDLLLQFPEKDDRFNVVPKVIEK